eukprot:scaffold663258_cov43-Prasinocladus_malaysianus.AAC.1
MAQLDSSSLPHQHTKGRSLAAQSFPDVESIGAVGRVANAAEEVVRYDKAGTTAGSGTIVTLSSTSSEECDEFDEDIDEGIDEGLLGANEHAGLEGNGHEPQTGWPPGESESDRGDSDTAGEGTPPPYRFLDVAASPSWTVQ